MIPIEGMTKHPLGLPLMVEAWASCVSFCATKAEVLAGFKQHSGHDLASLIGGSSLDRMIDDATGRTREIVCAWLDYVTEFVWGEEGKELPAE